MSVCHEIADRKHGRLFTLGKYLWGLRLDRAPLEDFVRAGLCPPYPGEPESAADEIAACKRQLARAWAFCEVAGWEVVLLCDGQARHSYGGKRVSLEVGLKRGSEVEHEVLYDEERPEDQAPRYRAGAPATLPYSGRTYVTVGSIYDGDALAPDPCAAEQARAEADAIARVAAM